MPFSQTLKADSRLFFCLTFGELVSFLVILYYALQPFLHNSSVITDTPQTSSTSRYTKTINVGKTKKKPVTVLNHVSLISRRLVPSRSVMSESLQPHRAQSRFFMLPFECQTLVNEFQRNHHSQSQSKTVSSMLMRVGRMCLCWWLNDILSGWSCLCYLFFSSAHLPSRSLS